MFRMFVLKVTHCLINKIVILCKKKCTVSENVLRQNNILTPSVSEYSPLYSLIHIFVVVVVVLFFHW